MNDRETRCYSGEVRAEQYDNAPTHILGYGSVFNSRSEPLPVLKLCGMQLLNVRRSEPGN